MGTRKCHVDEQERGIELLGRIFTWLLLLSERQGPHATGVAWLKEDGEHNIFKQPVPASEFIKYKMFAEMLSAINNRTTLFAGHTRWQTRGDASNNRNNHPIRAGEVIGTHNGTILNADELFERFELPRFAEVDSEIIFRMADATLSDGCIDIAVFKKHLALCRGEMSAVLAAKCDPKTVVVIKGNKPLELRYHKGLDAIIYASDAHYLDAATAGGDDWQKIQAPAMRIMRFECDNLSRFQCEPLSLSGVSGRCKFERFID